MYALVQASVVLGSGLFQTPAASVALLAMHLALMVTILRLWTDLRKSQCVCGRHTGLFRTLSVFMGVIVASLILSVVGAVLLTRSH